MALGLVGKWFRLSIGCAECGDTPLVVPMGMYDDSFQAQAACGPSTGSWKEHPQGGFIRQTHSGGDWVAPLETLCLIADDDPPAKP